LMGWVGWEKMVDGSLSTINSFSINPYQEGRQI
jgi:hypothetical protein